MKKQELNKERSLVIIKPDGVQRSLIGEIIKRYERTGLKLVALKFFIPVKKLVREHYLIEDGWIEKTGQKAKDSYLKKGEKPPFSDPKKIGERVLTALEKYISSGPVLAMIWQGNEAVGVIRKITGGTEPLSSDVGTVRGDFTIDSYPLADIDNRAIRNLIHASSSPEEAKKEINIWFNKKEIVDYRLVQEQILYDINLDGILE